MVGGSLGDVLVAGATDDTEHPLSRRVTFDPSQGGRVQLDHHDAGTVGGQTFDHGPAHAAAPTGDHVGTAHSTGSSTIARDGSRGPVTPPPPPAQPEEAAPAGPRCCHHRRMRPGPGSHLRIARPTRDLEAAERFWVVGLGLQVLWRSNPDHDVEGGHALLMVGWAQAHWHLELVEDLQTAATTSPSEEDLLVLYLDGPLDDDLEGRLVDAGVRRVPAHNPYWERWGLTITDPDGYRLVLSHRSWS